MFIERSQRYVNSEVREQTCSYYLLAWFHHGAALACMLALGAFEKSRMKLKRIISCIYWHLYKLARSVL